MKIAGRGIRHHAAIPDRPTRCTSVSFLLRWLDLDPILSGFPPPPPACPAREGLALLQWAPQWGAPRGQPDGQP